MREALERGDWDEVGRQIAAEWENRKRLAPGVTTPAIDALIAAAGAPARRRQGLRRRRRRLPVLLRRARRVPAIRGHRECGRLLDFTSIRGPASPARSPDSTTRTAQRRAPLSMARGADPGLSPGQQLDNLAIARILAEIADLLEIKGENPFKIRAYRNAAETIAHAAERIADLSPADRLRDFPASARISPRRSASSPRPARSPTIAGLLAGVSADHSRPAPPAGRRSEDRRACSTASSASGRSTTSRRAARDGRLRIAQGHGREEGSADPQGARGTHARRPAGTCWPSARRRPRRSSAALRDARTRRRPHTVGSLRRGCETCGDLDILAAGAPPTLMDAFTSYTPGRARARRTATRSRACCCAGGFQADLRLVAAREPRRRAAVLHRLEGAQHRAARSRDPARPQAERVRPLRAATTAAGRRRDGRRASTRRSASRWIPPELRENRGEIEAADARHAAATDRRSTTCAAICTCTRPRPTAAPTPRRWRAPRTPPACSTSPSPITARRWPWPTASTSGARSTTPRASARSTTGSTASRVLAGIECDIRADGTLDLADDCLARARHRHRLGPLRVHSGREPDDRPDPARHRMPVGRRHRPSDRPADSQARRLPRQHRAGDRRRGSAGGRRARDQLPGRSARSQRRHARLARDRGVKLIIDSDAHSPAALGLLRWGVTSSPGAPG